MTHLIIGIVGDILGHIAIKDLKVSDVGLTYRTGRADSSQFVILLPQISLNNFAAAARSLRIATSPFESLPLRSAACTLPLVAKSAPAGNNVAPAMPRRFRNERRLTRDGFG